MSTEKAEEFIPLVPYTLDSREIPQGWKKIENTEEKTLLPVPPSPPQVPPPPPPPPTIEEQIKEEEVNRISCKIKIQKFETEIYSYKEEISKIDKKIEKLRRIQMLEKELEKAKGSDYIDVPKDIEIHPCEYRLPDGFKFMSNSPVSKILRVTTLVKGDSLFFVRCRTQKICGVGYSPRANDGTRKFWNRIIQNGIPHGKNLYIRQTQMMINIDGTAYPGVVFIPSDNDVLVQEAIFGRVTDRGGFRELEFIKKPTKRGRYF